MPLTDGIPLKAGDKAYDVAPRKPTFFLQCDVRKMSAFSLTTSVMFLPVLHKEN